MALLHPSAVIEDGANIGENVRVGPFCVVGANVSLGDGAVLDSHVVVGGRTTIGPGTRVFPFASIGQEPQDLKYEGEDSELIIGANNRIREYVTIHPGTRGGGMVTTVGDNCLFMVGAHIAHDCVIGNNVILANNVALGGHVNVGDYAIIGGNSAVHQFVRIGEHAMIGGMSGIDNDVIPYGSAFGERSQLAGLNIIGLKRRGFSKEDIHKLRAAYQELFADGGTHSDRVSKVAHGFDDSPLVRQVIEFIQADSSRGLCTPKGAP
ncbi:MAG: acyl-ACP--UDP-N-acetylglucosamine O-acyltransferase [Rhodospirillales bacterium]|nr:acyl-ACP--UDP-N-acetylglucosamine O-acyltransferase [Rhodospirillales bacterium]